MAAELGRKAGEIAPLGPLSDRLLEERGRLGVRVVPLERPGEGQRGELADLVVLLVCQSAGLLERLAGIDRVAARSRGTPGGGAVGTGLDGLLAQVGINGGEDRVRDRLAVAQGHQADATRG